MVPVLVVLMFLVPVLLTLLVPVLVVLMFLVPVLLMLSVLVSD